MPLIRDSDYTSSAYSGGLGSLNYALDVGGRAFNKGLDYIMPEDFGQSMRNQAKDLIQDRSERLGLNPENDPYYLKRLGMDVFSSAAEYTPATLASLATRNITPTLAYSYLRNRGTKYGELRDQGLSPEMANENAAINAPIQAGIEAFNIPGLKQAGTYWGRVGMDSLKEGTEEVFQSISDALVDEGVSGIDRDWGQVARDSGYGFVAGGLGGGMQSAAFQGVGNYVHRKEQAALEKEVSDIQSKIEAQPSQSVTAEPMQSVETQAVQAPVQAEQGVQAEPAPPSFSQPEQEIQYGPEFENATELEVNLQEQAPAPSIEEILSNAQVEGDSAVVDVSEDDFEVMRNTLRERGIPYEGNPYPTADGKYLPIEALGVIPRQKIAVIPELFQTRANFSEDGTVEGRRIEEPFDINVVGDLFFYKPNNIEELRQKYNLSPEVEYIVVDGHHRYARAVEDNAPALKGLLARESDGWTREGAAAYGAERNIKQDRATTYDIANFFRNNEKQFGREVTDALAKRVGVSRSKIGRAIGSYASDEVYSAYTDDRIGETQASAIAEQYPDRPDKQFLLLGKVDKNTPAERVASLAYAMKSMDGEIGNDQPDMFETRNPAVLFEAKTRAIEKYLSENKKTIKAYGFADHIDVLNPSDAEVKNAANSKQTLKDAKEKKSALLKAKKNKKSGLPNSEIAKINAIRDRIYDQLIEENRIANAQVQIEATKIPTSRLSSESGALNIEPLNAVADAIKRRGAALMDTLSYNGWKKHPMEQHVIREEVAPIEEFLDGKGSGFRRARRDQMLFNTTIIRKDKDFSQFFQEADQYLRDIPDYHTKMMNHLGDYLSLPDTSKIDKFSTAARRLTSLGKKVDASDAKLQELGWNDTEVKAFRQMRDFFDNVAPEMYKQGILNGLSQEVKSDPVALERITKQIDAQIAPWKDSFYVPFKREGKFYNWVPEYVNKETGETGYFSMHETLKEARDAQKILVDEGYSKKIITGRIKEKVTGGFAGDAYLPIDMKGILAEVESELGEFSSISDALKQHFPEIPMRPDKDYGPKPVKPRAEWKALSKEGKQDHRATRVKYKEQRAKYLEEMKKYRQEMKDFKKRQRGKGKYVDGVKRVKVPAGFGKHLMKAKLTGGESVNVKEAIASYAFEMGIWAAKQKAVSGMKAAIDNIPDSKPLLKSRAKSEMNYILGNSDEWVRFKQAYALWLLSSPSTAIGNMTQPITTLWPELTRSTNWGSYLKAGKEVVASSAIAADMFGGRFGKNLFPKFFEGKDALLAKYDKQMIEDIGKAFSEGIIQDSRTKELQARMNGVSPSGAFDKITDAFLIGMTATEIYNRATSYIAGWRLATQKGLTGDARHAFANQLTNDTMYIQKKHNRPKMFRGGKGIVFGLFRNFVGNYIRQLRNMFEDKEYKALAGAMANMFMLAGIPGILGSKELIKLLEMFNFNPRLAMRERTNQIVSQVYEAFDADPQTEGARSVKRFLGDTLQYGVVGAAGGPNFSGVLGMPDLTPGWDYGPEAGLAKFLLGPAYAPVSIGKAMQDLFTRRGNPGKADSPIGMSIGFEEILPRPLKNLHKASRWTDEGIMLRSGSRILPDPTPGEKFQLGLGLQPIRMSKQYEEFTADYQADQKAKDKQDYPAYIAQAEVEGRYDEAMDLRMEAIEKGIFIREADIKRSRDRKMFPEKNFSKASFPERIAIDQIFEGR
jgi:hypothetical protein